MSTALAILVVAVVVTVAAYFAAPKFKAFVAAIWQRWFRDSEINLFADMFWAFGLLQPVLDDPQLNDLLSMSGFTPKMLIVLGLALRLLRAFRDRAMIPLTKLD